MRLLFLILMPSFLSITSLAQNIANDSELCEQIQGLDYLTISINHRVESYSRNEINIIYHQDSIMKIHSILNSNSENDRHLDTSFVLSGRQLMLIDKFGRDFNRNRIKPTGIVYAGTSTYFYLTLKNKINL